MVRGLRTLLLASGLVGLGCSLLTHYDPNGLPCRFDEQNQTFACAAGYSCAPAAGARVQCVADASLPPAGGCWQDRQCANAYICPDNLCRRRCPAESLYSSAGGCPSGSFCAPFSSVGSFTDGLKHAPERVGACRASAACQVGSACSVVGGDSGGVCVDLGGGVSGCFKRCEMSFPANKYTDNCGQLEGGAPGSCAAVGAVGAQQTICVQANIGASQPGAACSDAGQSCTSGYGCFEGTCAQWCEPTQTATGTCPANQQCCHRQLNPKQLIGFCAAKCPDA